MPEAKNKEQPADKSVDKKKRRFRLVLAVLLFLVSCVIPVVFYLRGVIDSILISILLAVSGITVAIILAIFDDLIMGLIDLWAKFTHRSQKPTLLLHYVINDYRWAKWLKMELIRVSYGDKVTTREWDIERDDPNDYEREIQDASKGINYIISIASKDYLKQVSASQGIHEFKRQVTRKRNLFANVIDMSKNRLEKELTHLDRVDLMKSGTNADRAWDLFLNGLPNKVRKHFQQPTNLGAANSFGQQVPNKVRKHFQQPTPNGQIEDETRFPGNLPAKWNIPTPSSYFTGREDDLKQLHDKFHQNKTPKALTGLQGIGTTEIAKEYANRYHGEYTCGLWIQMAPDDEHEKDLLEISRLLNFKTAHGSVHELQDSLINWLSTHDEWILVLDKCEDSVTAKRFIPQQIRGHILLTTSINVLDPAIGMIPVDEMEEKIGSLFLLRQARIIPPDGALEDASQESQEIAIKISREMGGFPKALYHAGILVSKGMTLQEFYKAYTTQRNKLAKDYSDYFGSDVYTWYVALNKFTKGNANAAELIRFCAFLYFEAIPLEILRKASKYNKAFASFSKDDLDLVKPIMDLQTYCLLEREGTDSLSINRVVQTVLRDEMDAEIRKSFAEQAVKALNDACPDPRQGNHSEARKYIPHAIICAELIQEYQMVFSEAVQLLIKLAEYKKSQDDVDALEYSKRVEDIFVKLGALQTTGQQP